MGSVLSDLGFVDIGLLVFFVWGLLSGFVKGFSFQLSRFMALLFGMALGLVLYQPLAHILSNKTLLNEPLLASLLLFSISLSASFLFKLLFSVLAKIVSFQFVYFIERVLGALLGGVRFVVFFAFLSYLVLLWPTQVLKPYYQELSYTGRYVAAFIPKYQQWVNTFKGYFLPPVIISKLNQMQGAGKTS